MSREYPQVRSKVTVTFMDGEFRELEITASPGIARYLAEEAGRSGTLVFMDGAKATMFPLAMVREWSIEAINETQEPVSYSVQGTVEDAAHSSAIPATQVAEQHGDGVHARSRSGKGDRAKGTKKRVVTHHGNAKPRKGYWRDEEET